MNLLFFQNIISPHQMPYIQQLPKMYGVDDVVVVVPEVNLGERDSLGWDTQKWLQTEGVRFVISPLPDDVEDIFKNMDCLTPNPSPKGEGSQRSTENQTVTQTWCLFSGINAFPAVAEWFRLSLKYQVKRGIITEPPYVYEHPLWQHAIRFALKDWRYVKHIDKIFVMGDDYLRYYRFWSKRWEVIPFMYCTEWRERENRKLYENENQDENGSSLTPNTSPKGEGKLKILYVGSLSRRKNVECLLKAAMLLNKDEQERLEIGIVGDGEQRTELEGMSRNVIAEVSFYGSQPMERIPEIMEQHDVLVLPSLHDGWGAVVNEALTLGLYVICSDHCGAKMLLQNVDNGVVFESNSDKDLASKISACIQKREEIRARVKQRIEWSREHISGKAVASYFMSRLK